MRAREALSFVGSATDRSLRRRSIVVSMKARPSGVTRFGCGKMGRSGRLSTLPSDSLTKALLKSLSRVSATQSIKDVR
jgi:hypothetical protein